VLHVTISVAAAPGPSPLRDHIAAARESGELVDLAVVPVRPTDADRGGGSGAACGNGGRGRHSRDAADPAGMAGYEPVLAAAADPGAAELETFLPGGSAGLLASSGASGAAGEITEAPADLGHGLVRLVFLGTGDGSVRALRRAGAVVGRRAASGRTAVVILPPDASADAVQAFAEGVLLGSYRYAFAANGGPAAARELAVPAGSAVPAAPSAPAVSGAPAGSCAPSECGAATGSAAPDRSQPPSGAVRLLATAPADPTACSAAAARAVAVAGAVAFARDLINTPSVRKSPQWLADQATELARRCGLGVRVRGGDELAAAGFGGIVAVGSGSSHPPRLIELSYEPAGWDTHVVLVGKGITFDSGGLSLKPLDGMKIMKTDMAGGAAVMAALSALRALDARVKVTGLVPAAENMPSGSAMRPGDVITQFGGRTVEVLNTDAEGRLVLADALAYADLAFDPDVIVDLATLTGAARIALGTMVGAMFTDDDDLAAALASAGDAGGERLWRLPIVDEYRDFLDSGVADLANIPARRYGRPGAIAAALFLREFSGGRRWAHLDIAGPARSTTDDGETTKGGTGFGTRVLLHWLAGR
jgi:leucyl aminopeptidase